MLSYRSLHSRANQAARCGSVCRPTADPMCSQRSAQGPSARSLSQSRHESAERILRCAAICVATVWIYLETNATVRNRLPLVDMTRSASSNACGWNAGRPGLFCVPFHAATAPGEHLGRRQVSWRWDLGATGAGSYSVVLPHKCMAIHISKLCRLRSMSQIPVPMRTIKR